LLVSIRRVLQVFRLKNGQSVSRLWGYQLIETDDPRAPFSFFNNLFWRRGADPQDPENRKILYHELAHIGGRHSWDGLFTQMVTCVFWMNPVFWMVRRELSVVHEFIADAATGMEGDAEGFARMLLQSVNEGRWVEPVQGFFQSPIKRRLVMISNFQRSRFRLLRMTLAIPVILGAVVFVACTKGQTGLDTLDRVKIEKQNQDLKFKKVVLSKLVFSKFTVTGKTKNPVFFVAADSAGHRFQIKQMLDKVELDSVTITPR
jgi:hypothetical protein